MFKLEYLGKNSWIIFNSYGEVWCGEIEAWIHPSSSWMALTPNCYAKEMTWHEVVIFLSDTFNFRFDNAK